MKTPAILAALACSGTACIAAPVSAEPAEKSDSSAVPMIQIYHLEGRRSERIVWLLEELNIPYELNYVRGDLRGSMALVHALGHEMPMVPTVVIEDQILVESGAIIETILARYAPGELTPRPSGHCLVTARRLDNLQITFWNPHLGLAERHSHPLIL